LPVAHSARESLHGEPRRRRRCDADAASRPHDRSRHAAGQLGQDAFPRIEPTDLRR
jgi:hypothetical protein